MADELTEYYRTYHETNGYHMELAKETSRVAFLKDYLKARVKPGGRVLDVGCGDMYLSQALPEYEWHGVDINEGFVKPGFVNHDLMSPPYPFEAGSFDAAICSEVLEHLWDLRVVHREVHRLLKTGGTYIMSTPNFDHVDHFFTQFRQVMFDGKSSHLFEHIRFYNYPSHMKFLQDAGFTEVAHVGADAHYSGFFKHARGVLMQAFPGKSLTWADKLLGLMFPEHSHTILIVAEKE